MFTAWPDDYTPSMTHKRPKVSTFWQRPVVIAAAVLLVAVATVGAYLAGRTPPVADAAAMNAAGESSAAQAQASFDAAADARTAANTAAFFGDSYTVGAFSSTPRLRFTSLLAKSQGWLERNLAEGGTGYFTAATDPAIAKISCGLALCPRYIDMLPAAVKYNPGIVVVTAGRNDVNKTIEQVDPAVKAFYLAVRKATPHPHHRGITGMGSHQATRADGKDCSVREGRRNRRGRHLHRHRSTPRGPP